MRNIKRKNMKYLRQKEYIALQLRAQGTRKLYGREGKDWFGVYEHDQKRYFVYFENYKYRKGAKSIQLRFWPKLKSLTTKDINELFNKLQ